MKTRLLSRYARSMGSHRWADIKRRVSPGVEAEIAAERERWQWPGGWQGPRYLVVWHGGSWMLTWHAPWCLRCDYPGAGWKPAISRGYVAGLGFELSWPDPGMRH